MNSTKTEHTPGPWRVESVSAAFSTNQGDYLITYSDGELRSHVARLFGTALCAEHGNVKSNARLIAAAPRMLQTLSAALDHSQHRSESRAKWTQRDQLIHEALEAAIALATGEQS